MPSHVLDPAPPATLRGIVKILLGRAGRWPWSSADIGRTGCNYRGSINQGTPGPHHVSASKDAARRPRRGAGRLGDTEAGTEDDSGGSALVGKWGRAETDLGLSFATTTRGPLTNPWLVQEFASDRSYRQWIVSADDTSNCFVHVEGRWRIVEGMIRFEDQPPSVGRIARSTGNLIASWTGLPVASPTSGVGRVRDIPFRLADTNDLMLDFPNQDRHDWTRLPGSFRDRHRLSPVRAQR